MPAPTAHFRTYDQRKTALTRLKAEIVRHEPQILQALHQDLGKCDVEAYLIEIRFVLREIDFALEHLASWMAPERVPSNFWHFPLKSWIQADPLGHCLILGPWNYPFQLMIAPLIGCIAAGNTAVLKPSELAPHAAQVVATLIQAVFVETGAVQVRTGGPEVAQKLLEQRWDLIFFTGSTTIGTLVAQAAARTLTPTVLELGGKSPVWIDSSVNLHAAAKRILWGKGLNAGQTCVAPDVLLVEQGLREPLVAECKAILESFYGADPEQSPHYSRVVNERHWERLDKMLSPSEVSILFGGQRNRATKFFGPAIVAPKTDSAQVLSEEIFGPILPIVELKSLDDALSWIQQRPKPLALYVFSKRKQTQERFLEETSSGGVVINDTMIHLDSHWLPFGGVGASGTGNYHGKAGFLAFSHRKSVIARAGSWDLPLKFPPYRISLRWLKRLIG